MRVLPAACVPRPLRRLLPPHQVDTTCERGLAALPNGNLQDAAEAAVYEVLITTNQYLPESARFLSVIRITDCYGRFLTSWLR